ncbi:hypothetical protein ABGB07_34060 [Micromonosporaceae bacterium B7E4]
MRDVVAQHPDRGEDGGVHRHAEPVAGRRHAFAFGGALVAFEDGREGRPQVGEFVEGSGDGQGLVVHRDLHGSTTQMLMSQMVALTGVVNPNQKACQQRRRNGAFALPSRSERDDRARRL